MTETTSRPAPPAAARSAGEGLRPQGVLRHGKQGRRNSRNLRELPRLFRIALSMGYHASPARFVTVLLLTVVRSSAAGAYVLALRGATNGLLHVQDGQATLSTVVRSAVPLLLIAAVQQIATIVLDVQRAYLGTLVAKRGEERVLQVSTAADLVSFESPEFANRLVVAQQGAAKAFPTVTTAVGLAGSLVSIATLAAALVTVMPALMAIALVAAVPTWAVTRGFARAHFRLYTSQLLFTRQREYLSRALTGRHEAKEIRAFGLAEHLLVRWERLYADTLGAQYAQAVRQAWTLLVLKVLEGLMLGVGVLLLLEMMLHHQITVAAATACAFGFQRLRSQSKLLHANNALIYENGFYLREWGELGADTTVLPDGPGQPGTTAPAFSEISVQNVSFSYPGSARAALCDVTLQIKTGEVIALVGENGSGKTTLAKLLAHLYHPTDGRILWDGVDIDSYDPSSVREQIAVIFQDFVRWELTARDNITMGRVARADDDDWLWEATRASGAAPLVARLPDTFDSVLSKTLAAGVDLSGGEWQTLALARAYFRDAPFVVLDEPTASMDPRAEAALFSRIRDLFAGRTVLLITHRFSSVRSADRILVLDAGRIIEEGSHDELMSLQGTYADLFSTQAAAYLATTDAAPSAGQDRSSV